VATVDAIYFIPFSIYPYYSLVQAFGSTASAALGAAGAFFLGVASFFFFSSNYYFFSSAASYFALTYANFL